MQEKRMIEQPIIFDTSDGQQLRINMINSWFKNHYGELGLDAPAKIVKLSLDGGFTCPNRDGTKPSSESVRPAATESVPRPESESIWSAKLSPESVRPAATEPVPRPESESVWSATEPVWIWWTEHGFRSAKSATESVWQAG